MLMVCDLCSFGMELYWFGYGGYCQWYVVGFWFFWWECYLGLLLVVEGGGGLLGVCGCIGLVECIVIQLLMFGWDDYDVIWVVVGIGMILVGLVFGEVGWYFVVGVLVVLEDYGVVVQVVVIFVEVGWVDIGYCLLDVSCGGFVCFDG